MNPTKPIAKPEVNKLEAWKQSKAPIKGKETFAHAIARTKTKP